MMRSELNIPETLRPALRRYRRQFCESFGIHRYSRPALNGLDEKLWRHVGREGGLFVEAGANDGFEQSNTYVLERRHGWHGLLVEPIPFLARECARNRRAVVRNVALGAPEQEGRSLVIHYAGLMSTAEGALGSGAVTSEHVAAGLREQKLARTYACTVPVRTLSSLLDELRFGREIDLLSLDVEGYELPVLRGLDLDRHAPRFLCIEVRDLAALLRLLESHYAVLEVLNDSGTYRDILFRRLR